MSDVVSMWQEDHARVSRVLDVLETQLRLFHAGETPDYALMCDAVGYLRDVSDERLHPRENETFARMVARDDSLLPPINRLRQEHDVIAATGEELSTLLQEVVDDAMVPRERLVATATVYLTYYRHHLQSEEHKIFSRAERQLTRDDWSEIFAATGSDPDPLLDESPRARYRELRSALSDPEQGP